MAITVIDAMNGMGQDWECSEVLRAEVRRLIDAREERERQYRHDWRGLRADLAAAEQRATDAEARAADAHATLAALRRREGSTLANKLRRANAATRDAKQRANESEKVITALAAYRDADRDYFASGISEEERSSRARRCSEARHAMFSALWHYEDSATLTAPATQPDERAAAERATDAEAEAWADKIALFILHKVTEATSLTLAEITPNLTAPDGWLSFARLWRADFIIVTGDLVQPTERGIAAMRELLICVADVELEATDGAAKEGV